MPLPALSLWPGRQPCRPRLVDGRRGGGPSSVAPRSHNPPDKVSMPRIPGQSCTMSYKQEELFKFSQRYEHAFKSDKALCHLMTTDHTQMFAIVETSYITNWTFHLSIVPAWRLLWRLYETFNEIVADAISWSWQILYLSQFTLDRGYNVSPTTSPSSLYLLSQSLLSPRKVPIILHNCRTNRSGMFSETPTNPLLISGRQRVGTTVAEVVGHLSLRWPTVPLVHSWLPLPSVLV